MAGELEVEPQSAFSYPLGTCEMRSWNMVSVPLVGTVREWGSSCRNREDQCKVLGTLECPCLPPHLTPELTVADRRQKREIRQLEQELHKWQVLVDSITGEEARGPGGAHVNSLPHPETLWLPG